MIPYSTIRQCSPLRVSISTQTKQSQGKERKTKWGWHILFKPATATPMRYRQGETGKENTTTLLEIRTILKGYEPSYYLGSHSYLNNSQYHQNNDYG